MFTGFHRHTRAIMVALMLAWLGFPAASAAYPERPLHLVIGLQAGASTDSIGRLVAQKLSERLGQPVIVENKPGAATRIGMEYVQKAAPDGYTLGIANAVSTAFPLMFDDFRFVPGTDFVPVTLLGRTPSFLAVRHDLPVKNVADFIAYAKAHDGKITFGQGSTGSNPHLASLELMKSIGVAAIAVPYKGNAPTALALASGEIDFAMLEYAALRPMVERGSVRLLAVTEPRRANALPDVPTGVEAGLTRRIEGMTVWFMLVAPASTPAPVVELLQRDVSEILQMPDVASKLKALGIEPDGSTAAEAGRFFRAQRDNLTGVVKELNMSLKE